MVSSLILPCLQFILLDYNYVSAVFLLIFVFSLLFMLIRR